MKETLKSFVLVSLIVTSLYQSWLLAYRVPEFDTVAPTNYVKPERIGEDRTINDIVKPYRIIVHYGTGEGNSVSYPNTPFYNMIMKTLSDKFLSSLEETTIESIDWKTLYESKRSIEIQFEDDVSAKTLSQWSTLRFANASEMLVNRMWIYINEKDNKVYSLLMSDERRQFWVAEISYTAEELKRYFAIGRYLPKYTFITSRLGFSQIPQGYYLPDESETVKQYRLFYQPITGEQMKSILFVDPSVIRQIQEKDGSVIYTDGNRGLQIRPNQSSMTYNLPVPPSTKKPGQSRLQTAIQFVNQHGGWNGNFLISQTPDDEDGLKTFVFRQYYGSLPIYDKDNVNSSLLEIQMVNDTVSTYSRSLMTMDKVIEKQETKTGDKTKILSILDSVGISPEEIKDVKLAYQAVVTNEYVDLIPVWVIDRYTTTPLFIPATSNK